MLETVNINATSQKADNLLKVRDQFVAQYLEHTLPLFQEYSSTTFNQMLAELEALYQRDGTLYICGNGGSAGTSNHMVNDLSKGSAVEGKRRLRVLGLADNMSLLTAWGNDNGYETVFEEQLKNLWRPGDVLIVISASGNSPNIVRAAQWTKRQGGKVLGLVGFGGGKAKELSDLCLHFKSNNYGAVEDAHLMFSHLTSQYLCQHIKEHGDAQNYLP